MQRREDLGTSLPTAMDLSIGVVYAHQKYQARIPVKMLLGTQRVRGTDGIWIVASGTASHLDTCCGSQSPPISTLQRQQRLASKEGDGFAILGMGKAGVMANHVIGAKSGAAHGKPTDKFKA